MDASGMASGPRFAICPMCEESKLSFRGLYSARCPACEYEPDGAILVTLRQIVTLPVLAEPDRRPRGARTDRKPRQAE